MSIPRKGKQRKLIQRSIEHRHRHANSAMKAPIVSHLIRPAMLFILIAAVLLLSLNKTAWATPLQGPAGQTVPTRTPAGGPDPTVTPSVTPDQPRQPSGTPSVTPLYPPASTSIPGIPADPTVVPIGEVPSMLPNTSAAPTASAWWIWALAITALAGGVGLRLWARRVDHK
jgi:hypothetical protein